MGFDAQLISTMALPWCGRNGATLNQRLGRDNRRLRVCGFGAKTTELSRCHVKLAWNEMIHEFVEVRWPTWNREKEVAEPRQRKSPK